MSLKGALETLLGGRCYHMLEVFARPDHVPVWHAAARGEMPDWPKFLGDYTAAVDWPASAFWPELSRRTHRSTSWTSRLLEWMQRRSRRLWDCYGI